MLKPIFLLIFLLACATNSYSQYFYYDDYYYDKDLLFEGGASVGFMLGVADVGERKSHGLNPSYYDWKSSKLSTGIYFGMIYKNVAEARIELTKGKIAGKDENSNSAFVRSRNLNYRTKITEASLVATFHPVAFFSKEYLPLFSPYILGGMSAFSFKPQTLYNDQWLDLRPQRTEGQNSSLYPARKEYSKKALSLIAGLGVKYEYSAKFNVRLEGMYRFSNNDYLDDASTSYVDRSIYTNDVQKILAHRYLELDPNMDRTGLPRAKEFNKDNFFNITLKVGYVIGREKRPSNVGRPAE